ncbi:hypothetical protein [Amycolatopsis tucumanensis]|uniref:hypothetical protein n=1 Tax=Amycolatopsis tucumanensis TaxID=401106 RepID=UPI003D744EE9
MAVVGRPVLGLSGEFLGVQRGPRAFSCRVGGTTGALREPDARSGRAASALR